MGRLYIVAFFGAVHKISAYESSWRMQDHCLKFNLLNAGLAISHSGRGNSFW
jgi:hypothetical protein